MQIPGLSSSCRITGPSYSRDTRGVRSSREVLVELPPSGPRIALPKASSASGFDRVQCAKMRHDCELHDSFSSARFWERASFPSVCCATFGIVFLAVFRQGSLVVARRHGSFPEIVERSGCGHVSQTTEDLPQAMHRLPADPSRRSSRRRLRLRAQARGGDQ